MFKIAVVDISARSRLVIAESLLSRIAEAEASSDALFGVSVKSLSLEEARFRPPPDLMVIGEELISSGQSDLAELRRMLPGVIFMAYLPGQASALEKLERIAALGFDDVIHCGLPSGELAARLVLNGRRSRRPRAGRVVAFDSGKGGVGVTSICAALADCLEDLGRSAVLVDLDFESQDLSRYLQCRPFLNENLQSLLDQGRPLTRESVDECVVPIAGRAGLRCVPPPVRGELHDRQGGSPLKMFGAFLEALSQANEFVLVDCASARGELARAAFRSCDSLILVTSGEACAAHSTLQAISRARLWLRPESRLLVLENGRRACDVGAALVSREVARQAGIGTECALPPVRHTGRAAGWPGSGTTLYGSGGRSIRASLRAALRSLGVEAPTPPGWLSVRTRAAAGAPDAGRCMAPAEPPAGLPAPAPRALITAAEIS